MFQTQIHTIKINFCLNEGERNMESKSRIELKLNELSRVGTAHAWVTLPAELELEDRSRACRFRQ
jgi:hypothetical protein